MTGSSSMEIALVSGNPHLPQLFGGVETNTHELACELARRGHGVSVFAGLSLRTGFGLRRAALGLATGKRTFVDHFLGYPVYRARRLCDAIPKLPRVTVAVIQNGGMIELADAFANIGVPTVAYFFGLQFEEWQRRPGSAASKLPFRGYLALSRFTAERFHRIYGLAPDVIPPIMRRERYETPCAGREVTFINPVSVKGVELALQIAALCPEIPFGFVRGWPLGLTQAARLRSRLSRLPNVTLRDRTSDMRTVYQHTKILMVPSQWEAETWGRVASEAQFSGIPVVASDRGGLPEAVGEGGLILGFREPAEVWAAAIRRLWTDIDFYREKSSAALKYSRRPALDPQIQVDALVEKLESFLCTSSRATAARARVEA